VKSNTKEKKSFDILSLTPQHTDTTKSKLSKQRDIEILVFILFWNYMVLQLPGLVPFGISNLASMLYYIGIKILALLPALAAFLLQGKSLKKLMHIERGQAKVVLALVAFKILIVAVLCISGLASPADIYMSQFYMCIIRFFYDIFVVGLEEEFVYRIYIQGTMEDVFGKFSFLAPLCSALIFGYSHTVNVGTFNAVFNVLMGLVWGYVRYFNKKYTYTAMTVTHGLSNYVSELPDYIYSLIRFIR
jgi:membrane protease YdiL (CAAX protease family)